MMDDEDEVQLNDVDQRDINNTNSCDKSNFNYSLAKQPPHQNLTVEQVTQKFGTLNFLPAFSTFLRRQLPGTTITPAFHDRFDAYKQILISLPTNQYLGEHILMDRVRTTPSVNASGRTLAKAAHFDPAFVVEDLALYKSEGGFSGDFLHSSNNTFFLTFLHVP